jgi:hypothetical protein
VPKARHVWIPGGQEERRLEKCQRPYLSWPLGGGDDGPDGSVGVGNEVRAVLEQFGDVGSV